MSYIDRALKELAGLFNTSVPRYITGARIPQGLIALYEPSSRTIKFREANPDVATIAHEFAHHLHTEYGIPCRGRDCEIFASMFEQWYSERGTVFSCDSCGAINPEIVYPATVPGMFGYAPSIKCLKCGERYLYTGDR